MLKILTRSSQSCLEREQEIDQARGLERKDGVGVGVGQVRKEQREQEVDECAKLFGIMAHRKEREEITWKAEGGESSKDRLRSGFWKKYVWWGRIWWGIQVELPWQELNY